jgi:hypothetical protein
MKLHIIAYDDDPVQRLVNWAKFHRMDYVLCYEDNLDISGYNIVITGDLIPETSIFRYVFSGKEVTTPCNFFKNSKGVYRPSFCTVTKETVSNGGFFPIYKKNLKIDEEITKKSVTRAINPFLFHICDNSWNRYDILWNIISKDWYKSGKEYVCRLYYHFWIESYHKGYITTKNIRDRVWMREQCVFSDIPSRKKLEGTHNMDDLKELISNHELKFDDCLNGIKGYSLDVDVSPGQFSLHPFSIHGVYQVNPAKKVEVDTSITVVGFFYDLGYDNKPKEGYYKSLEYFCKIKYPLVFFGTESTCKMIKKLRGDLIDYTHTVVKEDEEWELIGKYKDEYKEMDTHLGYRKRRRYAILTCNKIYAVMEAIKINPFYTRKFGWVDPGIYRHELAAGIKLEPLILKNIKIPKEKVIVPCFSMAGGSTHEEYVNKNHESNIAGFLLSHVEGWKRFFEKYDDIVNISFENGNFFTEQVVITRLVGLHTDLVEMREFTYHGKSVNNLLSLEWQD